MRLSREAKARHHQEIIEAASAMLRARGIDGTSVADLMQAAGLTHGGFYRHFESKDALVAEAVKAAFDGITETLDNRIAEAGAAEAARDYVKLYLSMGHIEHPEMGCPIATLGPEIARQGGTVRAAFAEGIERLIVRLADAATGDAATRRADAIELLCRMIGAVVVARAIAPSNLADEILTVTGDEAGR